MLIVDKLDIDNLMNENLITVWNHFMLLYIRSFYYKSFYVLKISHIFSTRNNSETT